jgi:hypothetical protein
MDSTTTSTSKTYTINKQSKVFKQYGWVCPLCGRANAPWISQCPCMPTTTWSGPIWSSSEWTNTPDYTVTTC